jgi:hypothetical protein
LGCASPLRRGSQEGLPAFSPHASRCGSRPRCSSQAMEQRCRQAIRTILDMKFEYPTDGLVFTPRDTACSSHRSIARVTRGSVSTSGSLQIRTPLTSLLTLLQDRVIRSSPWTEHSQGHALRGSHARNGHRLPLRDAHRRVPSAGDASGDAGSSQRHVTVLLLPSSRPLPRHPTPTRSTCLSVPRAILEDMCGQSCG